MMRKKQKDNTSFSKVSKRSRGFVLLFAVTLAAILLSIALSVSDVAFKEVQFTTSARDSNDALFAADTGVEKALYNDRSDIGLYPPVVGESNEWNFSLFSLGSSSQSCTYVHILKTEITNPDNTTTINTVITAKGYSSGEGSSGACAPKPNALERELKVTY